MTVQNDKELDIALGNSRRTKTWKNQKLQWSELLDRMANTTRTPETLAEYRAMGRDRQAEIKDTGGFVGGYCNQGRRTDVRFRSVLCLDADYADGDLWPDWLITYGHAAAVYSTHKHTPANPRLRLVVPLARDVSPDEYQAIGRRVAADLGIDKFDDTTYQSQRVMFWPSTSQDGEFYFDSVDAPFLDPDAVLSTYHNWQDASSWPMSSRVAEIAHKAAAKQQADPHTKGGLVGAFCRAYTIQEAIEAFVPVYQPCDEAGRYTYTEGSTAAGVVVYDDKFSYSHHATDPASGQLCNAWDLVRLHLYADQDLDCAPDTKISSRPSYKAMSQLASEDSKVKAQVFADRAAQAVEDFESDPEDGENWMEKLKLTEKGVMAQTIENAVTVLTHDPQLVGRLAYNDMQHSLVAVQSLPWRRVTGPCQWTDSDDAALRLYMEQRYNLTGRDRIFDAVNIVAQRNAFHPVREYLDSCEWDGVPRVETLLVDYLGAEDNPYTRAVTRKTLVAAVARIYRPGCKFDNMLTLRGRQGLGKSALIAKLGGEWFSDTMTAMQGKEAYEQLQGVWIMEVGELAGMRKAEVEAIKLYLSAQRDRFRPAYGRRTQEFPRQCIFVGTTNETQFLRDNTGNRRFWVVDTPNAPTLDFWEDLSPEKVKLIWGEAVQLFKDGESLYLSHDLLHLAEQVQATFEEESPRAGLVREYLDRKLPEDWDTKDLYERRAWLETDAEGTVTRGACCTVQIWAEALGGNPEKIDLATSREIRSIMSKLPEWEYQGSRTKIIKPYGSQRFFKRKEEDL